VFAVGAEREIIDLVSMSAQRQETFSGLASHTLAFASPPADAMRFPSGLNATA
jgi:hypothetical protein